MGAGWLGIKGLDHWLEFVNLDGILREGEGVSKRGNEGAFDIKASKLEREMGKGNPRSLQLCHYAGVVEY